MKAPTVAEVWPWPTQARQYPDRGPAGISYYQPPLDPYGGTDRLVDCLLWRDRRGRLRGILNRYPVDMPGPSFGCHYYPDRGWLFEQAGNVNVFVQPGHQRRGIGSDLVAVAEWLWGPLPYDQFDFTPEGAALAKKMVAARAGTGKLS